MKKPKKKYWNEGFEIQSDKDICTICAKKMSGHYTYCPKYKNENK